MTLFDSDFPWEKVPDVIDCDYNGVRCVKCNSSKLVFGQGKLPKDDSYRCSNCNYLNSSMELWE